MMETQAMTHCCLEPFRWESLRGWDFRPQLIVVSGHFGEYPFVDGILGHNLLLPPTFLAGILSWMGFWAFIEPFFTISSLFLQWNSGSQEAFLTNFFSFHDGISGYQEAFLTNFSFFTMEFWLSRSLSHELFLFSRWNSGYQGAFLTNFFFSFHDGILAIKVAFLTNFFSFHDGILAIKEPFSRTFFSLFMMEFSKYTIWGRHFSYIYRKEYLHRIRFVKNLAS
jgi:hypothetical protein